MSTSNNFKSAISGIEFSDKSKILVKEIRIPILNLIKKDYPNISNNGNIAVEELNVYREKYIAIFLQSEVGELVKLQDNIDSVHLNETSFVKKTEEDEKDENRNFGQIVADKVASFGGSWTFIISFFIFIIIWIVANVVLLLNKGFDPYPFILLNLILSCLAALQAPVIMMSQNRLEEKDRERAKKDYLINLKSELEIRMLDQKIDNLIQHQQQELVEIQKVQIEMMNDILARVKK